MISIIIPCFNAEKHVACCLDTLNNQIYKDWEAVFVNDGSTDKTLQLLQSYALKDKRIKVFTKLNEGTAKAREYGMAKVTGEYITFLDVDDTFTNNALEIMINAFDEETDIVVSGFNIVKQGHYIRIKKLLPQNILNIEYLRKVLCGKFGWELCAKMYRRKLFYHPLDTPKGIRNGEDAVAFIQLVCRAKKIKILSENVYNYIQYESSASHVKSLQYAEESLQAAFYIDSLLEKESFYQEIKNEVNAMCLLFFLILHVNHF